MRWFLVWLGLVAGIVLLNPVFWWLVAAEHAAAPVSAQADGSTGEALIGPKAPWPEWVLKPEGGRFTVKAWFGPSATTAATGFGEHVLVGEPKAASDAFVARLEAEGFEVTTTLWTTVLPDIPPRELVTCLIVGRAKDGPPRTITASIDRSPVAGLGRVHWIEGLPSPTWPKIEGPPC